ncbi:MAG: UDP-N-acetylmuramoylalanine--D-glutamate ligase [Actinomycetia bacterium]|nr:UDP-N-acetylmuramoylalanine--D-glutamate ligase [Actinomycetes bacterium]
MTRALVIGLAETGVAVAQVLHGEGWEVIVAEDAPAATPRYGARVAVLRDLGVELVEAPSEARIRELATTADLVVPSPLVRADHLAIVTAEAAGVPVRSEIDLGAERARMPIVAITGTNGKTTVTTMVAEMLDASGVRAVAAGNIGRPLIEAVADDVDVVVAEVSSFQLRFAEDAFRPRVAILLAVTPDHLDWHGSFDAYLAAKARIAALQTPDDLLVFDADDAGATAVAAHAPARTVGFSGRADATGCFRVVDDRLVFPDGRTLVPIATMSRAFAHDLTNALAAAAGALDVGGNVDGIATALRSYATMPHRVAFVGEANGVKWYDDSKATNPDATRRAVASFGSVVLLAGGRNKGLDLSVLAEDGGHLKGVVAFGEAGPEIAAAFEGTTTRVECVGVMRDAVKAAQEMSEAGDVVLLSPACASFDAYAGYGERGDDFAREVRTQVMEEATSR